MDTRKGLKDSAPLNQFLGLVVLEADLLVQYRTVTENK
jgi:hypothetical protein